jgi:hypothetical protein
MEVIIITVKGFFGGLFAFAATAILRLFAATIPPGLDHACSKAGRRKGYKKRAFSFRERIRMSTAVTNGS